MYGRKKKIMAGLLALFIFLTFRGAFADNTCGTNVKFTVSGDTISFAEEDAGMEAVWGSDCGEVFQNNTEITSVKVTGNISVTDGKQLFNGFGYVREMDLSKLDVSDVTDMAEMFKGCSSLTSLDVSSWDTSSAADMTEMFNGCTSLTGLDASGWNTFSVENMSGMFNNCGSLHTLALGENTVRVNIFGSLPAYGGTWYYLKTGAAAANPLPMKTAKTGGELFGAYDKDQMAGVWSADENHVLVESIKIEYPAGTDVTGKTVTVDAKEFQLNAAAEPAEAQPKFTWKSSAPDTAAVDANGNIKFSKAGTVTVTVKADDGFGESAEVTLILEAAEDPAEITAEAEVKPGGNTIDLDDCVKSAAGEVSYSIDGEDLGCSLDPDSHVLTSGEKTGTVTVTVTVADSDFHYGKTGTVTVSVIDKKQEKLDVEQEGAVFGGSIPAPRYTAPAGTVSQTVLYSGAGYGPSEEPPSESGSYTVTVRCETNDTVYTGTADFTIAPKPLSDPSITAKLLPKDSFIRTGKTIEITGAEVRDGDKLLAEGSDYELGGVLKASDTGTYEVVISAGADAGTAVSAEAKALSGSNYTGSITLTWNITPGGSPEPEFCPICCPGCHLPATGFSSGRSADPGVQPKELRYRSVPMRLQIPSLDLETKLVTVPLKDNSWQVEWLNDRAGLLEDTALPGEGVSVIAAHNTLSDTDYGPFALLFTLEVNDTVMVSDENGSLKLFRVYANELLAPDDTEKLASIAARGTNTLVLITCENESAMGGYLNRRAVFASLK